MGQCKGGREGDGLGWRHEEGQPQPIVRTQVLKCKMRGETK